MYFIFNHSILFKNILISTTHLCSNDFIYYRCGADTRILNLDGKTAEDVLLQEKPEGWQEMQHWYNKYKPGKTQGIYLKLTSC